MYIVKKSIKKKVKDCGFRCSKNFISSMDMAVDSILESLFEWVKPKKTLDRTILVSYLAHHKIKGK